MFIGYVGGKIPGHSGTERKHKKVFARRNQWVGARAHTNDTKRAPAQLSGEYKSAYSEGADEQLKFLQETGWLKEE